MTGVSVIQYYAPMIFVNVGIDTTTTLALQGGSAGMALVGQILCICYIDRLGRRVPFVLGNLLGGIISVIAVIVIALFPAPTHNMNASHAFVAMTYVVRVTRRIDCGICPDQRCT